MKILLLGSGGREHALAWKLAQSSLCEKLFIAPGNAGTSSCGQNIAIPVNDITAIAAFCLKESVDMVVVGPEEPLVLGIYDYFTGNNDLSHIRLIGPSKEGARLEGSKDYAKSFMLRHHIPTAAYQTFTVETLAEGIEFIDTLKAPYVLKADGLAAGKGVVILNDAATAKEELSSMLVQRKFGDASSRVVIEEFLSGIELSVFVLTDGNSYKIFPEAKDYKRIGDGDTGPNTGGMGAVSPVRFADASFMQKVEERIVRPTVNGLKKDGIVYKGWIFIGLMNVNGDPKVIEYNVRMGDPETEVVIPRIQSDLVSLLKATADGTLLEQEIKIDPRTAVTVMMVSGGYPESYEKGKSISGLDASIESLLFHAGTTSAADGSVVTSGGRVMAVTSFGASIEEARKKSYNSISEIHFDKMNFRKDIGMDLI
jgi:phosphoribosylamine--glycine ligase